MTTLILGLAGPVLGLVGVWVGIWYGERRWRQDRTDTRGDYFQTKRKEAYSGLWEVVQDAHMNMRKSLSRTFSEDFAPFLTNVNMFAWKHGLYIDEIDKTLAQEYLYLVYEFLSLVVKNEAAESWLATTVEFPRDVPPTLRAMKIAEDRANAVRDQLAERIRTAIGGLPELKAQPSSRDGEVLRTKFNDFLRARLAEAPSPRRTPTAELVTQDTS